ncbi:MAG: TIGR03986 family CRISPR-associated RAMP protein, partial [Pseudanabaena sp.]
VCDFFHNPYNFVPALPRDKDIFRADPETGKPKTELGDGKPSGHGSYTSDRWSGKISVTLTTVTPLLIPDAANAVGTDHKTYPMRKGADGKPYLPPTSIKGMLRSAYEAITNSRLSIFKGHDEKLVYRMAAKEIGLIPARVEKNKNETLKLHLMQAVKLPRYPSVLRYSTTESNSHSNRPISRAELNMRTPQHGDPVWVKHNAKKVVTDIQKRNLESSDPPDYNWKEGWVWVANQNIEGKKYERVFIESDDDIDDIQIDVNLETKWKDLIQNYKKEKLNVKGLKKRDAENVDYAAYLDREPAEPAFSRHIYEPDSEILKEGTLCYVELDSHEEVKALLPVTLSRHFYQQSPEDLLDERLKPSTGIDKLSPADRVFGWVNQDGNGSYKGQLRIHSVKCESDDAIKDDFGNDGLPLAILGQPKPQQSRFYAASNDQGEPLKDGCDKSEGYQEDGGLRGRKVYPHHQLPNPQEYWNPTQAS